MKGKDAIDRPNACAKSTTVCKIVCAPLCLRVRHILSYFWAHRQSARCSDIGLAKTAKSLQVFYLVLGHCVLLRPVIDSAEAALDTDRL